MQDEQNRLFEVIVINLKRSVSRRLYMARQLQSKGVKFSFFDATDGDLIDDAWIDKNVEKNHKMEYLSEKIVCVNKGALACADSHRRVWEYILSKGDNSNYLILEDDCFIHEESLATVGLLSALLEKSAYDVILLYYTLHSNLMLDDTISLPIKEPYRVYPYLQPTSNSLAYLVTVAGAAKLLSSQSEKITRNADAWDFNAVGAKAGIVHPLLFQTGDFPSTMHYGNLRAHIRRWAWAAIVRVPVIGKIARGMQKGRLEKMIRVEE